MCYIYTEKSVYIYMYTIYIYLHLFTKGVCSTSHRYTSLHPACIQVSSGASRIINLRRSCRSAWSAIGMVGLGNKGPRNLQLGDSKGSTINTP